jgi:zinc transport system substrate-binding protein
LKNAEIFCFIITEALSDINPDGAEEYNKNMTEYIKLLQELDKQYETAVNAAPVKTLLFADRFPFRYMVDDYGIDYYAAFSGCSAETEASFETIVFLAEKADELGLKTIMVTESSDKKIAETVVGATTAKTAGILVLNAMQSVTASDVSNGETYLSVMESNLNVLEQALQ